MFDFSARLAEERNRLGLSQEAFGAIAHVPKMSQLNYEKGVRRPDAGYLMAVATAGVDVAYLLTGQRSLDSNATAHDLSLPTAAVHLQHERERRGETGKALSVTFGQRLKQERERLGLSQSDMARLGQTKARTYQDWERGVATVSAEFLARIAAHGVDTPLVLTGQPSAVPANALSSDAQALLADYEKASKEWQALLRGVAALAAKE